MLASKSMVSHYLLPIFRWYSREQSQNSDTVSLFR